MKTLFAGITVLAVLASAAAQTSVVAAQKTPTPAERSMAAAHALIAKSPENPQGYSALALALCRRARETSDASLYAQAEKTLQKAIVLDPGNRETRKVEVWALLGRHEFAAALPLAQELNRQAPDDLMVYGFLTDANVELGNYKAAEEAAQFMLDLRPGNIPALTRAAYLRELFGDVEGALELMTMAYEQSPWDETEDRAWALTQIGHLQLVAGRPAKAEQILNQALAIFPEYHYALGNMARVRTAQREYAGAVALLRQLYQNAPHAENAYQLAEALARFGQADAARQVYREFEVKARKEMNIRDNANRELVFYYAGAGNRPSESVRIARDEFAYRHDVHTLDALAWALYKTGRFAEARQHMDMALAVGIKDPEMLQRAKLIAQKAPVRQRIARR